MRNAGRAVVRGVSGWIVAAVLLAASADVRCGDPEAPKPKLLYEVVDDAVFSLTVTADGKHVAARIGDGVLRLVDATTGKKVRDIRFGGVRGAPRTALSAGPPPSIVRWVAMEAPAIWDAVSGAKRAAIDDPLAAKSSPASSSHVRLYGLAVPSAGSLVFVLWSSADETCIASHDTRTGRVVGRLDLKRDTSGKLVGFSSATTSLAASFDGRTLVALGGGPLGERMMRVFQVSADGKQIDERKTFDGKAMSWSAGDIDDPAVTDDGSALVGTLRPESLGRTEARDDTVACWSTETGERLWTRQATSRSLTPSVTSGRLVALAQRDAVELVDVRSGTTVLRVPMPTPKPPDAFALAPAARRLFAATGDGKVFVWDTAAAADAAPK